MQKFAISDIHGCSKSFEALLRKINFSKEDELFLLGDYIDRGPDSKGVFDLIFQLQEEGYQLHCLRGNHEQLFLRALTDGLDAEEKWIIGGGNTVLTSFGVDNPDKVPKTYRSFIKNLLYYAETDGYILVHAGLNFNHPTSPFEDTEALLWIRNWYKNINREWLGDRIIVHGHTPLMQESIIKQLDNLDEVPVVDIDNGCVYQVDGYRHLCAFELTTKTLFFQPNID